MGRFFDIRQSIGLESRRQAREDFSESGHKTNQETKSKISNLEYIFYQYPKIRNDDP